MTRAPDQEDRDAAVRERERNVLVDAGAGTGKTTLLVERILELVAPSGGARPIPLGELAAITFTRKAAGELKFRIREALLRALAGPDRSPARRALLQEAVSALDTAYVGTIHGFADRLLRLEPAAARLSPSYEILEDPGALHDEAYDLVLRAAELGTLGDELDGLLDDPSLAAEAESAVLDALEAGVPAETQAMTWGERTGLDGLFRRFVETRDVPPEVEPPAPPDLARFRELAAEFVGLAAGSRGAGRGSRWVQESREVLAGLGEESDPARIMVSLFRIEARQPTRGHKPRKGVEFEDDDAAWKLWKAWAPTNDKKKARERPLQRDLCGPYHAWLARRLVRCAPVVVAAYEKVKRRRGAVDQVDLLLLLRDLLRDHPAVRARLQGLFRQVLVDEFQDTDPLQAEIVLFLCEDGADAAAWDQVRLAPGKLTIVGDPKQSIYRFRRADIAVYASVRELVARGPHLVARLTANFRCAPPLIGWLNHRFDALLGPHADGQPIFDAQAGTVVNERLVAGRGGPPEGEASRPAVVALGVVSRERKPERRALEAEAIARFLRAAADAGRREVVDPVTGQRRPFRLGDVAILTAATTQLTVLLPELDRLGIPHAVRGSRLFLHDALHRQFLLALRHLADGRDGVGEAALFRPPFFSLDLDDLARERVAPEDSTHPGVARVRAARALVARLRRDRLGRSPGATARDLLEQSALGRTVALGDNGAQRLAGLQELCLRLDAHAAAEGLDFDGATQRFREWVLDPVELDPPRPLGAEAVQILSIHQAKGLEFPVVVLWDACAELSARDEASAFAVDRDGRSWALRVERLVWAEPEAAGDHDDFAARERRYRDAERRRLVYVAATRARDLLVLPVAQGGSDGWIHTALAADSPSGLVEPLAPFDPDAPPAWAEAVVPARTAPGEATALHAGVQARWTAALEAARRPRLGPTSVTAEAHRDDQLVMTRRANDLADPGADPDEAPFQPRTSRFGPVFGDTVHRAIGLALADPALDPAGAVARAAVATGATERRVEAAEDVDRALSALGAAGLRRAPGPDLRLEYPVAMARREGEALVQGYVDLVGLAGGATPGLVVVDFKTDAPPPPGTSVEDAHPAYVDQVRSYARMIAELGLAGPGTVRAGLLFTATGELRWVR